MRPSSQFQGRRRRFGCAGAILVAMAAMFILLNALLWVIQAERRAIRQWRPTNTETGYRFPELPDMTSMEVSGWIGEGGTTEETKDFDVPEESWAEIIAALSPSAIDPLPPSCSFMGQLRIRSMQCEESCLKLCEMDGYATGAFFAGPSFEMDTFYRGGNTAKLRKALAQAYAESLRIQDDEAIE